MKKILSLFMSIVMLVSITAGLDLTANAEALTGNCGENGSNVTYSLDTESGILTISGTGKMNDYSSMLDTPWIDNDSSIKEIVINSGVTSIGEYAFSHLKNLKSITIPESVTSIGKSAFCYSSGLESITIPKSVTSIGEEAFEVCESLTGITVDDDNQYYSSQDGVLFNKDKTILIQYPIGNSRTTYEIPNSVTDIGIFAFYGCSSLTGITIPNSVTSIGNYAFSYCEGLTSIAIPESVESIGEYVFGYCNVLTDINVDDNNKYYSSQDGVLFNKDKTNLIRYPEGNSRTSYEIPSSVTNIVDFSLENCYNLTSVKLPDGVTDMGDYAFSGCINLTDITIPDGVADIGEYTFCWCSGLTDVTIPGSVKNIGYSAFYNCNSLKNVTIQKGVESIDEDAFFDCRSLTSVTIPDSITDIGKSAFSYCTSLTSVKIPYSVTSIGERAFAFTDSLSSITVDSNNQYYSSQDDVLFDKEKTTLLQYSVGNSRTSYEIPSSVTSIVKYAFYNAESLTSVTIPSSVTSIGRYAFYNCSSLSSVTLPNSITEISKNLFYNCSNLTSVTIPVSVTSIGGYAFQNCKNLKDVYYSGTEEQWNSITVGSNNECLTDSTIHYNYHKHIYSDVVTPASCTAQGYTTHTCTICGDSYVDSYTNSIDHNFNNGKNCVVCGAVNLNYVEPTTAQPATTVKKPKSTSIKKLTKGKKQFKVIWKKISGVTGYQIQYSTSKKFTKAKTKTVTVKGYKNTSKTIKKLKSKKTYYVRVRTYKTVKVNGKSTKAYSSWSKVKSVKTK